jgi:hypothetical protein
MRYRSLRRADHSFRGVLQSVVRDLGTSWMMRPWPTRGCRAKNKEIRKDGNYGSPCGMIFLQNFIGISWFVPKYWGKYVRRSNDTLNILSAFVSNINKMRGKRNIFMSDSNVNFWWQVVNCRVLRHGKKKDLDYSPINIDLMSEEPLVTRNHKNRKLSLVNTDGLCLYRRTSWRRSVRTNTSNYT